MERLNFLHEFIEEIPVGIARNNTNKIESNYYNDYLLKMLGWSSDEIDTMEKWFANVYPDEAYRQYITQIWTKMIDDTEQKHLPYSYPIEVKMACKDGSFKWCNVYYYPKDEYMYAIFTDISLQKEQYAQIQEKSEEYHALINSMFDGLLITDINGKILDANNAYCTMSGFSQDELIGMQVSDIEVVHNPKEILANIQKAFRKGHALIQSKHRKKDGDIWDVEISLSFAHTQSGSKLFSLVRDVTQRTIEDTLNKLRIELSSQIHHSNISLDNLLQLVLDRTETITQSQIGFFHFFDSQTQNVSLQVWSSNTLNKMCFAEGNSVHYPLEKAGVWVDCIHQNQSVIYNDYASLPHKKGLPHGHAPLTRFISVPLFQDDKIVAIVGMGNKESDYTPYDTIMVEKIAQLALEYYARLKAEIEVKHLAYHDKLTGLPNRELLADRLQQARANAKRNNDLVAICYMDLDGFKPVNDTYGHHVGDELLIQIAKRFKEHIRDGDTIARIGGDEFVIVLTGLEVLAQVHQSLERIHNIINQPFVINTHRIHITCSIGATLYPSDDNDTDTLLRHADQAMYQAKESPNTDYIIFNPTGNLNYERKMKEDFTQALATSQLTLHYQPKIRLKSGEIMGFEALLRWNHPQKGLLYPDDFLSIITATALEIPLGEWVIAQALKLLYQWHQTKIPYSLSVNISPKHIQTHEFFNFVNKELLKYPKTIAKKLDFEILETAAIGDTQLVIKNITQCKSLGIGFLLDDFGTGYASLAYFQRLPVDKLKIDQNFIKKILENSEDLNIVEGILNLSQSLQRPVVAEGVESMEIALMLLYMGCDYIQGYAIAMPMPLDEALQWGFEWVENTQWKRLLKYQKRYNNRDLCVAIYSYSNWVDKIEAFVKQGRTIPSIDEKDCQFTHWYKGVGRDRFGTRESFPFIQAIHQQAHSTAQKIHQALQMHNHQKALELLDKLKLIQQQLVKLLLELEKQ
ncbi:MAG: EAL domain-containing protein [Campylobacterales bacterium]|nr:EAL domain-containing protein [Campylobacterales bacterium]